MDVSEITAVVAIVLGPAAATTLLGPQLADLLGPDLLGHDSWHVPLGKRPQVLSVHHAWREPCPISTSMTQGAGRGARGHLPCVLVGHQHNALRDVSSAYMFALTPAVPASGSPQRARRLHRARRWPAS